MTAALEKELTRLRQRFEASPEGRAFAPLADCYRKLGRLDEALELCNEGLQRHSDYSTAVVILGKIHRDRGSWEEARDAFDRVLYLDPMNLLARAELARLFEKQDYRVEALHHWRQLLLHDPSSEEAEEAIARIQEAERAEHPREEAPADETFQPEPEDSSAEEAKAEESDLEEETPRFEDEPAPVLQADLDEPDEARRSPAAVSGPATPTLARIYYEQGFKAKALQVYQRVLDQRGEDPALLERIEQLREELQHNERNLAERPAAGEELLEAAQSQPAPPESADERTPRETEDAQDDGSDVEILAASIEASDPEREDYGHFRSWLDRIRER